MYTLLEKIKIRLEQFHMESIMDEDGNSKNILVFDNVEDNPIIEQLIQEAWDDIRSYRQYPSSYSDEKIENDLNKYEGIVIKLVVYDFNKIGIDGQSEDAENGNTRSYVKRESILANVYPLVTVLF